MNSARKIFIVVAGGNHAAEKHFQDTIEHKRTVDEVRSFLPENDIEILENIYHNAPFIVWGSVPGPMNEPRWEKMETGDIVLIYNGGYIKYIGEIAAKVRSRDLAKYFWHQTDNGVTWELMYFIVNDRSVNVPLEKLNPLFGYQPKYAPRGFSMVSEQTSTEFSKKYGDLYGVIKTIEQGEEIHDRPLENKISDELVNDLIERAPTEHDEIQWRLIRLGRAANLDIWVPKNDQGRVYEGNLFRDYTVPEFHPTLDVPQTIKNIDVVWKFGPYSVDSAFEIENSTSIYSGILRLSDLRAMSPNSTYPLFIVAPEERKRKVFEELQRPTFSGPCLRLHEVVKYLGYRKLREIDEEYKNKREFHSVNIANVAESVPS